MKRCAFWALALALATARTAGAADIIPQVESSFTTPGGGILALTWGDGSLWLADENLKIYRLDTSGHVQASFTHTISELSDLAWFENTLWAHDGYAVYKLDSSTGQILETLDVAYWNASGMEWAEGYLYLGNYNTGDIHKFDRDGNHIFSWPTFPLLSGHPQDMVYDGTSLWMTDSCEGDNRIWQYSLTGEPGDTIDVRGISECTWPPDRALAWDGRYFWWANRLTVYRLNIGGDDIPPTASVVSPSGGEYWLLSDTGSPAKTEVVTWAMSDNVRICEVKVSLWYSNDGGDTYLKAPAGGGLPATFGSGGACTGQGVLTTSLTYSIPRTFPSGTTGSLYKVQVEAWDAAGNALAADAQTGLHAARSANAFYIVRPNAESVRTLILESKTRMQAVLGATPEQAAALDLKLRELADHPRVQGFVVDLDSVTDLTNLYAAWDADRASAAKANNVLFGCHAPYPAGCPTDRDRNGIHDQLRSLMGIYTGVKYVVLVGDDRIIPMARISDHTVLLLESNYTAGGLDLRPTGTTVGAALSADKYLSDDPLVVLDPVRSDELSGNLFLPDVSVGRLLETPGEITTTIATFIGQDGILDLSALDASSGHKVIVTGYDFLTDSATEIRARWKSALGASTPVGSLAPVDGALVGQSWNDAALRDHLDGNGGERYGVMSLSGHATHYAEGVPGGDFRLGLESQDIYGTDACSTSTQGPLDLAGSVVYAVGCHGGLPVPGSCATDADHSLDLPQAFLSRGVVAYVANSGYGWGLKSGIGYAERLMKRLTEEMTRGGTVVTGDAVRLTKQRYFLETPRYDAYDEKSLMEWTFFGLPMYAVQTGIASTASMSRVASPSFSAAAPRPAEGASVERFGGATVLREIAPAAAAALPSFVTQLNLHFDFTASGVYEKRDSNGATVATAGCPSSGGCYYELNGLSTGDSDLPIQPYFIYDSRLSGTSQHGVLWKGGVYDQESGWKPVIAELASNGGDASDHGSLAKKMMIRSASPRVVPGQDPSGCRTSDLEVNSTVVGAGEAVRATDSDPTYSIERRYRTIDLEVLYFNDTETSTHNCDRSGPTLGSGPYGGEYHQARPGTIEWAVPAADASGVWRVIAVVNDNSVDAQGRGLWVPVELADDGSGTWRGSRAAPSAQVTYVIQAADRRGNVTWLDFVAANLAASGVAPGVPRPVDAAIPPTSGLAVTAFNPTSGSVGTGVSITGTGFTGATAVTFNGVPAPFLVNSNISITTLVPTDATTGPVAVTTPTGTAAGVGVFTVGSSGDKPILSIDDVPVVEGNGAAFFTVSLSGTSSDLVSVGYETTGGTAVPGEDYDPVTGVLTLPPGATEGYVRVPIRNDSRLEGTEDFFVNLSFPVGATLGKARGEAWILDLSPGQSVAFSSASYSVSERASVATITARRSGGGTGVATVRYATSDGTAAAGHRYKAASGTLTFPSGVLSKTFTVPILHDTLQEPRQTVLLSLSDPTGMALGSRSTAVLAIGDDDVGGQIQFALARIDAKVTAGSAPVVVRRAGGIAGGVTVDYSTEDGTATDGIDYQSTAGTLSFAAGAQSAGFLVPVLDDHTVKGDLTVRVHLADPTGGATLGPTSSAIVAIRSDDPVVQFTAATYAASGAGGSATISVRRSGRMSAPMTVDYEAVGGSATPEVDYHLDPGTLSFKPGVAVATFKVAVLDAGRVEGNQTVSLALNAPVGGGLGLQATAVLTLKTNDAALQFGTGKYTVADTAPQAVVSVKRVGPATGTATVDYATADGSAEAGTDYQAVHGTLTFPPRATVRTFAVPILQDAGHAAGKTVNLTLARPSGAYLGTPSTSVLTLLEHSPAGQIAFAASDFSVAEVGPAATISVTRSAGTGGEVTVAYEAGTGSALDGVHFTATSGTLVFLEGETSKTFLVPILDDGTTTGNVTVRLTLSDPGGGAILGAQDSATLWIVGGP